MVPKKPVKPTKLQQKAAQKNKVLTGPKGSKPQGTTTNRVRTQGGTTMSKPAPSAGRRINPKAAKPKPAAPKPARPALPPAGGTGSRPATARRVAAEQKLKTAAKGTRSNILRSRGPATSTPTTPKPSVRNTVGSGVKAAADRVGAQAGPAGRNLLRSLAKSGPAKVAGKVAVPVAIASQAKDVASGFQKLGNSPFIQKIVKGGKRAPSAGSRTNPKAAKSGTPKPTATKGPSSPQRQDLDSQERKARQKLSARKAATKSSSATPNTAASFDSAFKDARRAKVKSFTWRGKKYTTKKAGE
jgi:hypothetical protein